MKSNSKFVEIESIELLDEKEDVFDIEVEATHNFFANDILVHNCLGGVYAGDYWENRLDGEDKVLAAMRETTKQMKSIFGDRWYAELQWNSIPEQHELNQYIIKIAKEFDVKLISTADSHYPRPSAWKDRILYKKLGWIAKGVEAESLPETIEEVGYELYPKNGEQMWESYKASSKKVGVEYDDKLVLQSITETHDIAFNRIDDFFPDNTVHLPDFVVPPNTTAEEELTRLSLEGLKKMKTSSDIQKKVAKERLDYELSVIKARGFSKYFLTMKAISDRAKQTQLVGPGRGSAAGSLVAYVLGITQVDPLKWGLQFERFLTAQSIDGIVDQKSSTKVFTSVVKISLDNSKQLVLTPDLSMNVVRDGKKVQVYVKDLKIGDEIVE